MLTEVQRNTQTQMYVRTKRNESNPNLKQLKYNMQSVINL